MTVEERAEQLTVLIASHVFRVDRDAILESDAILSVVQLALRDQIEACAKVADKVVEHLQSRIGPNELFSINVATRNTAASLASDIRALAGPTSTEERKESGDAP